MHKSGVLGFKIGQRAEMRTFEDGYRSAWFNCKILDMKKNEILLEYFNYEDEKPSWVKIYQKPPYGRKSKYLLMVRPPYPATYRKDNMPPANSLTDTCVVINGPWKVGNLVDWFSDDCYWTSTIIKVLSDDKVQIELPEYPVGERKNEEEGRHLALCKDLRPSLDWSKTKGWTFPVKAGQLPCDAHLLFQTTKGTDVEVEHAVAEGDRDTCTDTYTDTDRDRYSEKNEDAEVEHAVAVVNASSTTGIPAEGDRDNISEQNENVKLDCGLVESSESVSSLRVEKRKAPELEAAAEDEEVGKRKVSTEALAEEVEKQELNITRENTLEAAVLDLEGMVNKINWMQRLLQSPATTTTSSWKFA
ncbi:uncharacterized protein LOC143591356 [Bidens hawaiensis]|uniref:uncharacterized protein LOC143591356 n=1 Tax=Bidens hawaiensis TaxID=980011 RepID=UPI004049188B